MDDARTTLDIEAGPRTALNIIAAVKNTLNQGGLLKYNGRKLRNRSVRNVDAIRG